MIVELKACVAKTDSQGNVLKEFDQWWLHVDGERLGIVPKAYKGHIALTRRVDEEKAAAIKAAVEEKIGERSVVSMPPEVLEDEEDEDDDES